MATYLSPHFSLEELSVTQVRGVDNTPPPDVVENLKLLAAGLEEVRAVLGVPIHVNSGYRCQEVNERVGGSPTSDHPNGWCGDIIAPKFGTPLEICHAIVKAGMKFDQLIEEGTWVHFSRAPRMRGQIKTKGPDGKLIPGLREG